MSFIQQIPRIFNKQNVEAINANQLGVYGIFRDGCWIYVGKGDIRQRLLDHLNGDIPSILAAQPTHWVNEVCGDPAMSNREKQLIVELEPLCNEKIG
ncbi:MAG: hypothetical protein PHW53_04085 [Patescibacteria group bacterium]|nr:hypothetical protein [Patescibacteria group bacterium]